MQACIVVRTLVQAVLLTLLFLNPFLAWASTDPLLERVTVAAKKWLQSYYRKWDGYKGTVVDEATRTPAGAEVKGRVLWTDGCPRAQRWHFVFGPDGVMDEKQSIVRYPDDARRCYEAVTPLPAPLSTLETDSFVQKANVTCELALRRELKVHVLHVSTEEVVRFGDGGVNLRGSLETAALNYAWVCKVGPDGNIRSRGKDVMLLPRRSVQKR